MKVVLLADKGKRRYLGSQRYTMRLLRLATATVLLTLLGACSTTGMPAGTPVKDLINVTYPSLDGKLTLGGYLAKPSAPGSYPAVLMVHEWWGLTEEMDRKADLLAQDGFVVLAIDAMRGRSANSVPAAILQVSTTPKDQIDADVDAALAYLKALPEVDATRVGATGFCFGGTTTMRLGIRDGSLKAAVIFYGSGPVTDVAKLGHLGESGPVLGIFGTKDSNIPTAQAVAFSDALKAKGVGEVHLYEGEGHAFVKYDTLSVPGASQDGWNEMKAFLERNLKG
ncbi:MAG: dienelactone hydrolase family protein [Spirochaetales bacterium]